MDLLTNLSVQLSSLAGRMDNMERKLSSASNVPMDARMRTTGQGSEKNKVEVAVQTPN